MTLLDLRNLAIVAVIFGILVAAFSSRPRPIARHHPNPFKTPFPPRPPFPRRLALKDHEGHRRADPPINLKALDAAVERGE